MAQTITLISEPAYLSTLWYLDTLAGLQTYAAQKEWLVRSYTPEAEQQQLDALGLEVGRAVILLGTSHSWIERLCRHLQSLEIPVLVVGGQAAVATAAVSVIGLDYRAAMGQVLRYLADHGRCKPAMLGHNPASVSDIEKVALLPNSWAVYQNNGDLTDCVQHFMQDYTSFDAVVCSNDVVALQLLRTLRQSGRIDPLPFFIVSFGDTLLGSLSAPSLTSVTLNYKDVGRQAGALLSLINASPVAMSITCRVGCQIIPRQTTGFFPVKSTASGWPGEQLAVDNLFYKSKEVQEVLLLEELLSRMDSLDCRVLLGVLRNATYEQLAEQLHISEGTVKYRLRRMMRLLECQNRGLLLATIESWLGPDALLRLVALRQNK